MPILSRERQTIGSSRNKQQATTTTWCWFFCGNSSVFVSIKIFSNLLCCIMAKSKGNGGACHWRGRIVVVVVHFDFIVGGGRVSLGANAISLTFTSDKARAADGNRTIGSCVLDDFFVNGRPGVCGSLERVVSLLILGFPNRTCWIGFWAWQIMKRHSCAFTKNILTKTTTGDMDHQ